MRRLAPAGPLLGAALIVTGCATERTLRVQAGWSGEAGAPCTAEIEGRRIAMRDLPAFARRWRGREAHVDGDVDTPYRCIGSAIYALQRAGFQRIGFISEPAPQPDR
jgi:hypothetical protein